MLTKNKQETKLKNKKKRGAEGVKLSVSRVTYYYSGTFPFVWVHSHDK